MNLLPYIFACHVNYRDLDSDILQLEIVGILVGIGLVLATYLYR